MNKPFTKIAVAIFGFATLAHLCRLFMHWEVVIAGYAVPLWASAPAAIVSGALVYLVWGEAVEGR